MRGSRTADEKRAIERNIRIHDRISREYERRHGEIFNDIEQGRLTTALRSAAAEIRTDTSVKRALDFGCGSGNLTAYLIAMGMQTVAADVSRGFLDLVEHKFGATGLLQTMQLNGRDLPQLASGSFDLVAAYSVLHHVPDYLGAVREMCRVLRPGGILYIDHEENDHYWKGSSSVYKQLQRLTEPPRWYRYLEPRRYLNLLRLSWYVAKYRRYRDPRYSEEGDIHVWADDHIDWPAIERVLDAADADVLRTEDYLLYRPYYPRALYEQYRARCSDVRLLVGRKRVVER